MTTTNPRSDYRDVPQVREARPAERTVAPRVEDESSGRERRSFMARFAAGASAPVAGRFELHVL